MHMALDLTITLKPKHLAIMLTDNAQMMQQGQNTKHVATHHTGTISNEGK